MHGGHRQHMVPIHLLINATNNFGAVATETVSINIVETASDMEVLCI